MSVSRRKLFGLAVGAAVAPAAVALPAPSRRLRKISSLPRAYPIETGLYSIAAGDSVSLGCNEYSGRFVVTEVVFYPAGR